MTCRLTPFLVCGKIFFNKCLDQKYMSELRIFISIVIILVVIRVGVGFLGVPKLRSLSKSMYRKLQYFMTNFYYDTIKSPFRMTFFFLVLLSFFVYRLARSYYDREFFEGIIVEAHGVVFDVFIFGVLLLWLNSFGEKARKIQHYLDEIDDFSGWESHEASCRIAGNIKRLNELGDRELMINDAYLVKAMIFPSHHIKGKSPQKLNLRKSLFLNSNLNQSLLASVDWRFANIEWCVFNKAELMDVNFSESQIVQSKFINCDLSGVKFDHGKFLGCNFSGATFESGTSSGRTNFLNASFIECDFTGVKDLDLKRLQQARTLYNSKFDQDILNDIKTHAPHLLEKPDEEILKTHDAFVENESVLRPPPRIAL